MLPTIAKVYSYFQSLQDEITRVLLETDEAVSFKEDRWYKPFSEGRTRIFEQGDIFEKAGIGFSLVSGDSLPVSASSHRKDIGGAPFHATGVSLVFHPHNPYIPTTHMNVRFFIAYPKNTDPVWWFGGGFDLTPYYIFEEDCIHWHTVAFNACEPFGTDVYPRYKKWCDEYFFIKHRNETRGVGGLFFDDLYEWGFEKSFSFTKSVAEHFIKAYFPIVEKRATQAYTQEEKDFQLYRRGRYAEFNLVYDRGTLFGLQSGGRTESILMSMPPQANWVYNYSPADNTPEKNLYEYLKPIEWLKELETSTP